MNLELNRTRLESDEEGAVGGREVVEPQNRFDLNVTVDRRFPIITFEQLEFQSVIGYGGFGAVELAFHREWGQHVAVKRPHGHTVHKSNIDKELLYSEARKLNFGSRSDHVISLLGVCLENFAIVMPYMENGSLAGLLRDVDVPWALRWRMSHEISLGMTFLHSQNPQILHCDLKTDNVLLDGDFHVKISDFGLSKWSNTTRILTTTSPTGGTITHAPPEYLLDINFIPTDKFDVYSFGVLLWETITRRKPYENAPNSAIISLAVSSGQRPDIALIPTDRSDVEAMSKLMQACWSQEPKDRPSSKDCAEIIRDVKNCFSNEDILQAIIYVEKAKRCQHHNDKQRSCAAIVEAHASPSKGSSDNGVGASVQAVHAVSLQVNHPAFRNRGLRDFLPDGTCDPQITELQANRNWLVKLTNSFITKVNNIFKDTSLVALVMYPGQYGAVVFDCLSSSDPELKQPGYNERCIPMDQSDVIKARLEGNIKIKTSTTLSEEMTFRHPRSAPGDLNKKEVFLTLRDSKDPSNLGYIIYSNGERVVAQMPISVEGFNTNMPEVLSRTLPTMPSASLEFRRFITSLLGVNFIPLDDKEAEAQRQRKMSEWERAFSSDQSCSISSVVDDLINHRKGAVCKITWPGNGSGSGFLLGKAEIITNDHVFQSMSRAFRTNTDLTRYKATFVVSEHEYSFNFSNRTPLCRDDASGLDFAILELASEPNPALIPPLGPFIAGITASTLFVVVVGYPFGGPKQLDYAHMAHVADNFAIHVKFGNPHAPTSGPNLASYQTHSMYFGSSGSPGFDNTGNVILLHTKGFFPYHNRPSVIEQGIKLSSIVDHVRSKNILTDERFNELFPGYSSRSRGYYLFEAAEQMEVQGGT
ncbi:uncharacterized protein LOC144877852 [Branchiostoma floridae x Branchiostoma japonicum]